MRYVIYNQVYDRVRIKFEEGGNILVEPEKNDGARGYQFHDVEVRVEVDSANVNGVTEYGVVCVSILSAEHGAEDEYVELPDCPLRDAIIRRFHADPFFQDEVEWGKVHERGHA